MNIQTGIKHTAKARSIGFAALAALTVSVPAVAYASNSENETDALVERNLQPTPGQVALPAAQKLRSFANSFSHINTAPKAHSLVPGAVDITEIEPPVEKQKEDKKIEEKVTQVLKSLSGGMASYYGKAFAGRRTANGERFNPAHMTAAHRTLPFGSKVKVTNKRNGRSVVVRINDRGPFAKGRVIDLSRAAGAELGLLGPGHAPVKLELVK